MSDFPTLFPERNPEALRSQLRCWGFDPAELAGCFVDLGGDAALSEVLGVLGVLENLQERNGKNVCCLGRFLSLFACFGEGCVVLVDSFQITFLDLCSGLWLGFSIFCWCFLDFSFRRLPKGRSKPTRKFVRRRRADLRWW